ncbi:MAG TPA: pectate lyase [Bacteroidetes bacterium]|nr:pectate lyase [Bacteroidota bacterium]
MNSQSTIVATIDSIETSGFYDSAHHWYDINDEVHKIFKPLPNQQQYAASQIALIADNILLYQKSNGGWEKNYDMMAILTTDQKKILLSSKNDISLTTFDNGSTHSQVEYLAEAYFITNDERYKAASLRGLDFMLSAQYPNGGFPQFFPDTSGYRKYITFNDGAMGGVLKVFHQIIRNKKHYSFVDQGRREKVRAAFDRGVECIVKCQIRVNDTLTAWCQQHDNIDLRARKARTFEPAAICSQESAELVLLLMSIKKPNKEVVEAINGAVEWFQRSRIFGIKVETVKAPKTEYMYHTTDEDKIVVKDKNAPTIWARMYEIGSNVPLFCNRNGKPVYSLAEVERERRTGYGWYNYQPEVVLKKYAEWKKKNSIN